MLMPVRTLWPSTSMSPSSAMQQPLGERLRRGRLRAVGADDVNSSPPSRARKAPSAGGLQAVGDFAQQPVADRMAEHVVDFLEAVEVDADDGEILAPIAAARRASHRGSR